MLLAQFSSLGAFGGLGYLNLDLLAIVEVWNIKLGMRLLSD